jgi:hypothetical protein
LIDRLIDVSIKYLAKNMYLPQLQGISLNFFFVSFPCFRMRLEIEYVSKLVAELEGRQAVPLSIDAFDQKSTQQRSQYIRPWRA